MSVAVSGRASMVEFGGLRRMAVPGALVLGLLATPGLAVTAEAAQAGAKYREQIKDQWIVTFDKSASESQIDTARDGVNRRGGKVGHRYKRVARGFSANMSSAEAAQMRKNPHVL